MCGIAGWLGHIPHGYQHAARMAEALHHRGPDAHGIRSYDEATLIHTRLSIIDLSPAGSQPMSNEDGTVWTVFNGEIYNHHELRERLKSRGHGFRGTSDTEVIPHLYEDMGWKFISELRGMFALAVYDTRNRTLVLARDRFGIKPLFHATLRDRLMFSSEIQALRLLPGVDDRPNRQAISDFTALFYIPAPETFYAGICALQPGEVLQAQLGPGGVSHKTRRYHSWAVAPDPAMTLEQAEERGAELLTASVRSQIESDVPLGALLSGGIDSSLVSAAAQAATTDVLRTFNVRFGDREYDETEAALAVARHIRSSHRTLDADDIPGSWEHITQLLRHAGQPFADTSLFAVNAVCQHMRRHVTVALSGDGGDEGFGGYSLFRQIRPIALLRAVPARAWGGLSAALGALPGMSASSPLQRRVAVLAGADDTSVVQELLSWVREDEHARLCRRLDVLPVRRLFEPGWEHRLPSGASRLERLSAHSTEVYTRLVLPNDFLFKVDTASMKESLEVRVPMLDEELFAFGLSLPHSLKESGGTCKRVLRGVASRWLPASVATKRKQGFSIPVDRWVDAGFKRQLKERLLDRSARLAEYLHPETYGPMVEAFCDDRPCPGISRQGLYQRAIMLLALELSLSDESKVRTPPRLSDAPSEVAVGAMSPRS